MDAFCLSQVGGSSPPPQARSQGTISLLHPQEPGVPLPCISYRWSTLCCPASPLAHLVPLRHNRRLRGQNISLAGQWADEPQAATQWKIRSSPRAWAMWAVPPLPRSGQRGSEFGVVPRESWLKGRAIGSDSHRLVVETGNVEGRYLGISGPVLLTGHPTLVHLDSQTSREP